MGPLFHVLRAPMSGQVWVLACLGRRGSRLVSCVRRFRPPPLLWSVFGPSPIRFSFPLPFQGSPAPGQVCWWLCFLLFSFFFCVPPLGFRLSNCSPHVHCHFMLISMSPTLRVCHLNRCKTSIRRRGATAHLPILPNEATEDVVDGFMDA